MIDGLAFRLVQAAFVVTVMLLGAAVTRTLTDVFTTIAHGPPSAPGLPQPRGGVGPAGRHPC